MTAPSNFAIRLKAERERLGLSQARCAKLAGVSLSGWRGWDRGRSMPADKLEILVSHGFDLVFLISGARGEPKAPAPAGQIASALEAYLIGLIRVEIQKDRIERLRIEQGAQ